MSVLGATIAHADRDDFVRLGRVRHGHRQRRRDGIAPGARERQRVQALHEKFHFLHYNSTFFFLIR